MNIDVANYLNDKERFTRIDIFRLLDGCLTSFEIYKFYVSSIDMDKGGAINGYSLFSEESYIACNGD